MGDCRPLHIAAVEALRAWRPEIRVHVYEEGYIRPDWVTLEDSGVNARSPMPRRAEAILPLPEAAMPRYGVAVGASTVRMGIRAMFSYFAMFLLGFLFRNYEHHRPDGPLREAGLWLRRLGGRNLRQAEAAAREAALYSERKPYFLVLLQLNVDKQIVFHSPFANMQAYLERVCQSFAAHAPPDSLLVVKAHPLDNGRDDHEGDLAALGQRFGIAGRVRFIDGGNLIGLLEGCRGAVTVNSTAGISALHRSIPLIALGHALFDLPGLCHQGGLDSFWTAPEPVDSRLYHGWRNMISRRSQVNGSFYSDRGIQMVIDGSLPILEGTAGPVRDWPPLPAANPVGPKPAP
nr:capsular biosynthesis protein [Zavarzinia compransoris]